MFDFLTIENTWIDIDAITAISSGPWSGDEKELVQLFIFAGGKMSFDVLPQIHRDVRERWKEYLTKKFATN